MKENHNLTKFGVATLGVALTYLTIYNHIATCLQIHLTQSGHYFKPNEKFSTSWILLQSL